MKHFLISLLLFAPSLAAQPANPSTGEASVLPVAEKFLNLFDRLRAAGDPQAKAGRQHVSFQLSETEINQYLQYSLKTTPRPGLESVAVKLFPKDYIATDSVIDFDAVERWKPGTVPKVLRPVLSGKKSVKVDFRIQAVDGLGRFTVEKAYYQDVRIPALVVEEMIAILASRQPEKYDTHKPLPLPFGLRKIWTTDNHALAGEN